MTEMTRDELVERYNAGERIFDGIKLVEWSLSGLSKTKLYNLFKGVVLRDIMLRGADIRFGMPPDELNMTGADLSGANLRGAYFEGVDLTGANLTGAIFRECCLHDAIIRDANLWSANVCLSNLSRADLRGSNLNEIHATYASFSQCKIASKIVGGYHASNFRCANGIFIGTNFSGADISKDDICGCRNLVWDTIMPGGGTIEKPQRGSGRENTGWG